MIVSSTNLTRQLTTLPVIEKLTKIQTSPYDTYSVRTHNQEDLGVIKHNLKTNTTIFVSNLETLLSVPRLNYLALYMQQLMINFEKQNPQS